MTQSSVSKKPSMYFKIKFQRNQQPQQRMNKLLLEKIHLLQLLLYRQLQK